MNCDSESGVDDLSLECKICFNNFSTRNPHLTPRILTACGHTVCQNCASNLLPTLTSRIICPFDRKCTPNVTDVMQLSKNFALLEVLEQREAKVKGGKKILEEKEAECAGNEEHKGEWFCASCDAVFCEGCFTENHSKSFNKHHEKVRLSKRPYKLPKCPKHPKNNAEFMCTQTTCEIVQKNFCQTCLFTTHKEHAFEELEVRIKQRKEQLRGHLDDVQRKREELQKEVEKMKMYEKVYSADSGEYVQLREDIQEWFMERINATHRRVTQFRETRQKKVREIEEKLEEELIEVEEWSRELQKAIGATEDFDFERVDELVQRKVKGVKQLGMHDDVELSDEYPKCEYFCSNK